MDKQVEYNQESGDFDLYLAGHYVGSASTATEGYSKLGELAYQELVHEARLVPVA